MEDPTIGTVGEGQDAIEVIFDPKERERELGSNGQIPPPGLDQKPKPS